MDIFFAINESINNLFGPYIILLDITFLIVCLYLMFSVKNLMWIFWTMGAATFSISIFGYFVKYFGI